MQNIAEGTPKLQTDIETYISHKEGEPTEQGLLERQTLQDVLGYFLSRDLGKKNYDEIQKGELITKRLPVYFDALKRGLPIITDSLKQKPLIQDVKIATKELYFEGEQLRWRILPKSADPFDKLRFYKSYEDKNIPTEDNTSILIEPIIVTKAIEEGLRQQNQLFIKFENAYKSIVALQIDAKTVLQYIEDDYVNSLFTDIQSVHRRLMEAQKTEGRDLKDLFIENYAIDADPIQQKCENAISLCNEINAIQSLFYKKSNNNIDELPTETRMHQHTNTLVVELTTNPESISNPNAIRTLKTTVENVFNVSKLTHSLKVKSNDEEYLKTIYKLTEMILRNSANSLNNLFENLGISTELGMNFFRRLIYSKLKNFPGGALDEMADQSPQRLTQQPKLNQYYIFDRPIESEQEINSKSETQKNKRIKDSVNDFWHYSHNQKLSLDLDAFSPEEQREILKDILDNTHVNSLEYQMAIERLMKHFELDYLPSKKFGQTVSKKTSTESPKLHQQKKLLIETCLIIARNGNENLINALDNIINKTLISIYINGLNLPKGKSAEQNIDALIFDYVNPKEEQEDRKLIPINYASISALQTNNQELGLNQVSRFEYFKEYVLKAIKRIVLSSQTAAKPNMHRISRLESLYELASKCDFEDKATQVLQETKENHFRDYPHASQQGLIIKLLEDSIEEYRKNLASDPKG